MKCINFIYLSIIKTVIVEKEVHIAKECDIKSIMKQGQHCVLFSLMKN